MSEIVVFIHEQGTPTLREMALAAAATFGELQEALEKAGIKVDHETLVFVDDAARHHEGPRHEPVPGVRHGCRIHVTRCKHIKTTVHYHEKTAEHEFPPGARVRAVKEWAVHTFELAPKDAAEHVLQICKSTERPATDTPLQQLVPPHECSLCFDLVPEKRVEG